MIAAASGCRYCGRPSFAHGHSDKHDHEDSKQHHSVPHREYGLRLYESRRDRAIWTRAQIMLTIERIIEKHASRIEECKSDDQGRHLDGPKARRRPARRPSVYWSRRSVGWTRALIEAALLARRAAALF
jgi:hypothetical protein